MSPLPTPQSWLPSLARLCKPNTTAYSTLSPEQSRIKVTLDPHQFTTRGFPYIQNMTGRSPRCSMWIADDFYIASRSNERSRQGEWRLTRRGTESVAGSQTLFYRRVVN